MNNVLMLAFTVGVLAGIIGTALFVSIFLKAPAPRLGFGDVKRLVPLLVAAFVAVAVLAPQTAVLAQTPVPLEIPTDVIFSETNNWLATFAPIAAIGIGIAIALAVLGYLGKMIVGAFKG